MARHKIRLGISTCPNDTFAFHGLLSGEVRDANLDFRVELLDIQQLNDRLFENSLDVAKTSFHAALLLADRYVVLPTGSALGFGNGPLLLSRRDGAVPQESGQVVLCPGQHTTATLLYRLFYPETTRVEQCIFSEIMPRLQAGSADFGVCIHEGRFTWQQQRLHLVEDLGRRWEQETGSPLPLGGLVARRNLPGDLIDRVNDAIRRSLEFALANPEAALPTMRHYAQEYDDEVLRKHVDLYVNEWTVDLGATGADALARMSALAQQRGVVSLQKTPLQIHST